MVKYCVDSLSNITEIDVYTSKDRTEEQEYKDLKLLVESAISMIHGLQNK